LEMLESKAIILVSREDRAVRMNETVALVSTWAFLMIILSKRAPQGIGFLRISGIIDVIEWGLSGHQLEEKSVWKDPKMHWKMHMATSGLWLLRATCWMACSRDVLDLSPRMLGSFSIETGLAFWDSTVCKPRRDLLASRH
jgi:hypothetical protein